MINKIIKSFHVKHENTTSQLHKDLLLVGTILVCIAIRLGQALLAFILFPPIMLAIGVWECIKQLGFGLVAWPMAAWEYLEYIPSYAKAFRQLGQETLPVNRKPPTD